MTPAGIPLPDALSENRQLSLQIMLISYPFNLSIVQYFSSKFAHIHVCIFVAYTLSDFDQIAVKVIVSEILMQ